jgi:hypothetical protein
VGARDLPSEPEEPGRPERSRFGGADRLKAHETPDPDERGRVYEAMKAHVSAETRDESEPGRRPDGNDKQSYRDDVPLLQKMWADHEKRWPARSRGAVDRSDEPPGVDTLTSQAARRAREAEPGLSADAQAIEQENEHCGWLEGFKFRLKEEDRLKEKVVDKLAAESAMPATQALREVGDAIRYTYCFQPENYAAGYCDIKERLESRDYEMYFSKNWWPHPEYKGINTRWITQDGQRFEVQFHTPDSFHAKHDVTHVAYERIRDSATSRSELPELHAFQREVSSRIQVPDGAADIPDYRKEGF